MCERFLHRPHHLAVHTVYPGQHKTQALIQQQGTRVVQFHQQAELRATQRGGVRVAGGQQRAAQAVVAAGRLQQDIQDVQVVTMLLQV